MPQYRVGLFWNQFTFGWSETYITRNVASSGLAPLVQGLLNARNTLLWRDFTNWVGVRISIFGDRRRSALYLPGIVKLREGGTLKVPDEGERVDLPSGFVEVPDQVRVALQVQMTYDDSRKVIRYIASIPDGVSKTEPGTYTFNQNADWGVKLQAFFDFLVSESFAIAARVTAPTAPEVQARDLVLEAAAPGRLGVAVRTADAPPIAEGDLIHLRGFRRSLDHPGISLNGKFYVSVVNTTLLTNRTIYFLRGTEGQDPNNWKVLGKVQQVLYGTFPIQLINPHRVGVHKRGRPSLSPRGRRVTRRSLDP